LIHLFLWGFIIHSILIFKPFFLKYETRPIKKIQHNCRSQGPRTEQKEIEKKYDSTCTKTPASILLRRRESRIRGGGFPAAPGDARGRGKPPFSAPAALTLEEEGLKAAAFPHAAYNRHALV